MCIRDSSGTARTVGVTAKPPRIGVRHDRQYSVEATTHKKIAETDIQGGSKVCTFKTRNDKQSSVTV